MVKLKTIWRLEADKKSPDSLRALFKQWQIHALNVAWAHPEGIKSAGVWRTVNTMLAPETISRASVILFLNKLVDSDVLDYEERTGKGGYHRVYKPAMTWPEFEDLVIWRFIEKLMLIFPEKDSLREKAERLKVQA